MSKLLCFAIALLLVHAGQGEEYGRDGGSCDCNCNCSPEIVIEEGCDSCESPPRPTVRPIEPTTTPYTSTTTTSTTTTTTAPTTAPTTTTETPPCPEPFEEVKGTCYYYYQTLGTYAEQAAACSDQFDGYLALIDSMEEYRSLSEWYLASGFTDSPYIQGKWFEGVWRDADMNQLFTGFTIPINSVSSSSPCARVNFDSTEQVFGEACNSRVNAICERDMNVV